MKSEIDNVGCVNNTIITSSGLYFDYANPLSHQICIEDIAFALANTCRFGGHCKFYSVAEHSYHCFQMARELAPTSYEFHRFALLHDAAEAYIGDMTKPLKNMMPEFRELENAIESLIAFKYGLDHIYEENVKHIDLCMLKAEKKHLFPSDELTWHGFDKLPDVPDMLMCWSPIQARRRFLAAFQSNEIMLAPSNPSEK